MAISKRICSIENCCKPVRGRGWCNSHWLRWSRYGDPLGGGTSKGELLRFYNEVVLSYEGNDCLSWPYGKTSDGYGRFDFKGERVGVHRAVCEEVNGPPPSLVHEAAHSCGNGHLACVTKRHLTWKTRAENFADKLVHDTHNRGERNGASKLTEETVKAIKSLKGQMTLKEIGRLYGTSAGNVSHIHRGDSWGWL